MGKIESQCRVSNVFLSLTEILKSKGTHEYHFTGNGINDR